MRFDPQTNAVPNESGFEEAGRLKSPRKPGRGGGAAGALILLFVAVIGGAAWFVDQNGGLQPAMESAGSKLPPEVTALLGGDRDATDQPAATDESGTGLHFVRRDDAQRETDDADGDSTIEVDLVDRTAFDTGKAYMAIGRHAEALPHLREAVRLEPDFAEAWYKLGVASVMSGERDSVRDAHDALQSLDTSRASMLSSIMSRN